MSFSKDINFSYRSTKPVLDSYHMEVRVLALLLIASSSVTPPTNLLEADTQGSIRLRRTLMKRKIDTYDPDHARFIDGTVFKVLGGYMVIPKRTLF